MIARSCFAAPSLPLTRLDSTRVAAEREREASCSFAGKRLNYFIHRGRLPRWNVTPASRASQRAAPILSLLFRVRPLRNLLPDELARQLPTAINMQIRRRRRRRLVRRAESHDNREQQQHCPCVLISTRLEADAVVGAKPSLAQPGLAWPGIEKGLPALGGQ